MRYAASIFSVISLALFGSMAVFVSPAWAIAAAPFLVLTLLAFYDVAQKRHNLWRIYPIIGHLRWAMEAIRPELQQYFVESNTDGAPFNRDIRSLVYQRAKLTHEEDPFGTELNLYAEGHEWFNHSIAPLAVPENPPKVTIGGPDCTRPYDMALLNVSALSFGSLSSNAIAALNKGAAIGGFAHDTGEGSITRYHLEHGGDLIWEIGSAYFGCRTPDGAFDPSQFRDKANIDPVKMINIKLSQGAKPGLGGVMPGEKVTPEIAEIRGVPVGKTVVSPPNHSAFSTPRELIEFVASLREMADGRPVGFKLCIGHRRDFLAICKAMLEMNITPDFIVIDGSEGGTGAAPLEFVDHVGTPLTEGLIFAHNALVGTNLRDRIKLGCSGKIASGFSMAARIAQGADYTNSARAMMFALGCIQAKTCHNNKCPVGVATQDPARVRGLDVDVKAERVANFQRLTVESLMRLIASMGLSCPEELDPSMLMRRLDPHTSISYAELYRYLKPGELLGDPPEKWAVDWAAANPDRFGLVPTPH